MYKLGVSTQRSSTACPRLACSPATLGLSCLGASAPHQEVLGPGGSSSSAGSSLQGLSLFILGPQAGP